MLNQKENKQTQSDQQKYLEFDLGSESYAIPLLTIKEVIPVPETTILPNQPVYFMGIMNLRGQIISIIDLRVKLKIKPRENKKEEAVLIVDISGVSMGLIVDSINKVLWIKMASVVEVPEIKSQMNAKYIQGVHQSEGKLTILMDIVRILDLEDIKRLSDKAA